MPATLRINLLGGFRLFCDDTLITSLNTPRLQSLVTYLVLHRDLPQPRQHLAFLLWPDSTEAQARTNLRKALHELRQALPHSDRFLQFTTHTVQWCVEASFTLDVADFDAAIAAAELPTAIALYRGDLLPNCYDDWILPERERLSQVYVDALERLSQELEQDRDYPAAITYAQQLLRYDALREEAYRSLMRLHSLRGNRADALRIYHTCTTTLQRELGVEPSVATREMYESLLNYRPDTASAKPTPALIATTPLIGRKTEWAQLQSAWRAMLMGQSEVVVISGEAGIGKTRLAEELVQWAERQGVTTANAHCYAAEGALAYAPIKAWLRARPLPALAPVWLSEVARLLPEVLADHPDIAPPGPLAEVWQRQRLFEALAQAMLSDRQPVLLLIEDLQWCDRDTLDWLHYLLRFDPAARLLLIGTLRPEEIGLDHPVTALLNDLRGHDHFAQIELSPLTESDTAQLARHVAGRELDVTQLADIYRETEGNPLFIVEALRAQAGGDLRSLTPRVQTVITTRLTQLSPAARDLIGLAATIGRAFNFDLLRQASDEPEGQLVQALDELWQRRLVRERGAMDYDFSHDKIREVAYAQLSAARQRLLHRRVAEALEQVAQHATEHRLSGDLAAQLGHHYAAAGNGEKAVPYLLQAGDRAREVFAWQEAIEHYKYALALLKQEGASELIQAARTAMNLGGLYHCAMDFERAQQSYDEAFNLWQHASETPSLTSPFSTPQVLSLYWGDFQTLDLTLANDASQDAIIEQLFSGLVELTPDFDVVPMLARRWEILDDGHRYVFNLRRDARWSDGHSVTAHDFECAWRRVLDPVTGSLNAAYLYPIQNARAVHSGEMPLDSLGIRVLDDFTLLVDLEEPTGYFLQLLTCPATFAISHYVVDTYGAAWCEVEHLVTNGPFRLAEWKRGEKLILTRNADYCGRFSGNLVRVELTLLAEQQSLDKYDTGEHDIGGSMDWRVIEQVRQRRAGEHVRVSEAYTVGVGFDTTRAPFDKVQVRQAFVCAVDRETLARDVMHDLVAPATGGFVPPGLPGHSPGIGLTYDPERARRLLAEAGYPQGHGFPAIEAWASFPLADQRIHHLQTQWREHLGIDITWQILDWDDYQVQVPAHPPHLFQFGWIADYPDPDNFLRVALYQPPRCWRNLQYDELIDTARHITDPVQRLKFYQAADRLLMQEAGIMPLTYGQAHLMIKPWVKRYPTSALRASYWKDVITEPH